MSVVAAVFLGFLSIIVPGFFIAWGMFKKTSMALWEIVIFGFILGLILPPTMTWLEGYLIPLSSFFAFSAPLYNANVVVLTIIGIALCVWQGAITKDMFTRFMSKSSGTVERKLEGDFRQRIAEVRSKLRGLHHGAELIRKHENEEEQLLMKQRAELNSLQNISAEEKARLAEMHAKDERRLIEQHEREETAFLRGGPAKEKKSWYPTIILAILLVAMLVTFATRMESFSIAPNFFEFDPYFDMISTEWILSYGYQLQFDHSAWPVLMNGSSHTIQPLVPYLEAYWYDIAGGVPTQQLNQTLLSQVSSLYPPIVAALLVFVIFIFIRSEYGDFPAIVGALLTTAMAALYTAFIAGEQLLEPWGIFAMFLFYATYMLAVKNMKDYRYAILAGIAFVSTFLGAHYFTVNAAVFALYILLQGVIDIFKKQSSRDFYKMNAVVLGVIVLFYLLYAPYGATLYQSIPDIAHIPVIIAFPLFALIIVGLFEYLPKLAHKYNILKKKPDNTIYLAWMVVLAILTTAVAFSVPQLRTPLLTYVQLSEHYTTPSIPLFATVQEYEPTGANFDFGSAGFGLIGASIGGVNILVWGVLIVFTILEVYAIITRGSRQSILALAVVWPLAAAGMSEVKYLPHFGVAYIIAICAVIGELLIISKERDMRQLRRVVLALGVVAVLIEMPTLIAAAQSAAIGNCAGQVNSLGADLYCNVVPNYWLNATAWMRSNVGPYGARILAWWDYGDWINWFGNSNAVLRGDNAVATLDYATAAQFVFGPSDGYNASTLGAFMDTAQANYVLFDNELLPKWGALNFLACVDANQTSLAFAEQQGVPYALGHSQCELAHDPAQILIPENLSTVSVYCSTNSTAPMIKALILAGSTVLNQTYCIPELGTSTGAVPVYYANGTKTNALFVPFNESGGQITPTMFYQGVLPTADGDFLSFILLYAPNGPNDTITDAPTEFYDSNYYRGFYLGDMPGYTLAYPAPENGINYVNYTSPIVIWQLDNFTGSLPPVTPKPSYAVNNYTVPG